MKFLTDKELANIAHVEKFLLFCDQDEFNDIARCIEAIVVKRCIYGEE